ncbi:alpha/beta fold hydrolase [Streptomyces violaceoruber]|uniref:Esterase n=3 Tax=Streptomyces TaxID=1883 RepID=A0ABN4E306_STRLI|nr:MULTISPECIES: alpha/beta fold hydrolase [Streptomyces]QSJ13590.1 esterase [Streptomyces lividans]AIJ17974.1 esterase [Streptomyces lividans TK24]EFD71471.1 esterase [Streptomyces lividans TK24]KKD17287.1 esterase [Streptomyces sp. WM6391]MBQ0947004.1 enterochelin esterase [Streptomyces sp. RK76]
MRWAGAEDAFAPFGLTAVPGTDAFWDGLTTPRSIPDGDGWTTLFLRRGPRAASIVFESWSAPVPLRRWRDTDCWYAEVRMPPRLRVTYRFVVGEEAYADPYNPAGAGGERSVAATPDAPAQPHWPLVGAGDVLPLPRVRLRWTSERLGGRRTVRVHPVGGGGPVVLLLDGDDWLYLHPATSAFDSAVASGEMPPVTLVFLPAGDRGAEFGCRPALWEAVRDELLPLVAGSGVRADPGRTVVAGQSLGGLSALYAALEFPELVSRVACQSASLWWTPGAADLPDPLGGPVGGAIAARLRARPDLSGLRIAFDVGEHERRMLPHCALVESLTKQAGATVRVSRSASGHDRAGWRHALLRDVAWALA